MYTHLSSINLFRYRQFPRLRKFKNGNVERISLKMSITGMHCKTYLDCG